MLNDVVHGATETALLFWLDKFKFLVTVQKKIQAGTWTGSA
jgi:hypothetical protein